MTIRSIIFVCSISFFLGCQSEGNEPVTEAKSDEIYEKVRQKALDAQSKKNAQNAADTLTSEAAVKNESSTNQDAENAVGSIDDDENTNASDKTTSERESKDAKKLKDAQKSEVEQKPKVVQKPKAIGKPKISWKSTTHSFDTIVSGDKFDHKFTFKNTGNAPLVIKSATPSCGCTLPSYPFIPIEPGESGYIGVSYNSVGKLGRQTPDIKIVTNANPASYTLILEGEVLKKESPQG